MKAKPLKYPPIFDAITIVLLTIVFASTLHFELYSFFPLLSFVLNGGEICIFLILARRRASVSIELVYWIFMYFFMFFAPLIQYSYGEFPWVHAPFPENTLIIANIILFIWNLIVGISINVPSIKLLSFTPSLNFSSSSAPAKHSISTEEGIISKQFCLLLTIISLAITASFIAKYGLSAFNSNRSSNISLIDADASYIYALGNKIFDALFELSAIIGFLHGKQNKNYACFIVSIFCLVICLFPTTIARYHVAVIYGGLALICLKWLRTGSNFLLCFTIGVLFIFPLIEIFRRTSPSEADLIDSFQNIIGNFYHGYTSAHYDAYSMFCSVIEYIRHHGTTHGMQLLGTLLFFIPRSLWPGKPVGSGYMVSTQLGYSFHNVSCPLVAEFMVNFGYPGAILGAILIGRIIKKGDASSNGKGLFARCFYPVAVMFTFFILRGDLMSSLAYITAYAAVFFFMLKLNSLMLRYKRIQRRETIK